MMTEAPSRFGYQNQKSEENHWPSLLKKWQRKCVKQNRKRAWIEVREERGTAKKGFITFLNTDWLAADVKWDDPAYEGGSSTVSFELLKLLKPRAVKPAQAKYRNSRAGS